MNLLKASTYFNLLGSYRILVRKPEGQTTPSSTGHIFVQLPLSNVARLRHVGGR